jgi:hypothetical protein
MPARSLKVPLFDGEHKKFQIWWTRFMAYDGVFGFSKALKEGGETEMMFAEEMSFDKTMDAGKLTTAALRMIVIASMARNIPTGD